MLQYAEAGCAIVSTGSGEFFMVTAQLFVQTSLAAPLIEITVSLMALRLKTYGLFFYK